MEKQKHDNNSKKQKKNKPRLKVSKTTYNKNIK